MRRGFLIALLCAAAARAQEEPTPFWLPPPPPKKEAPKPAKKKPVRGETPKPRKKEKPPPSAEKRKRSPEKVQEPGWVDPSPAAEPAPRPKHAPIEVDPENAPKPRAPAATLPPAPEPAPAHEPSPAREPASPSREPAPAPDAAPSPARETVPALALDPQTEPSTADTESATDSRHLSLDASFGAWARSTSDGSGRSWQLAYGVRFGYSIFPSLEAELDLVRASATAGSPFVNASTAHNLAALRAFYVFGDRVALLLGCGGGVAIVQTHYTLQPSTDLNSTATGIDATGIKPVIEVTAAARARIFRGLEARAEVSALARDGRIDFLPLLGAGWAF